MATLTMPSVADSTAEYLVLTVEVAEGDEVAPEDVVLVVETDKAQADVPAGVAGVVTVVLVAPDDEITVGDAILNYEETV